MAFRVGDRVKATSAEKHRKHPEFYPEVGTTGTIIGIDSAVECFDLYKVRWARGSTSADDIQWARAANLEPVEVI